MTDRYSLILATMCTLILTGQFVFAHRINVFAEVRSGKIEGECYSSNGKPLPNATVKFVSPDDTELGTTQSDANGTFNFTPAARVDHRIVLDTGDGHRATFVIKASDLPKSPATASPPQPAVTPGRQSRTHERQWRWRDVFSGIGYIFGIAGVVLYFKSRRRRAPEK